MTVLREGYGRDAFRAVGINPSKFRPSIEALLRRVARGDDQRSGRWAGSMKTECGIHITADGRLVRVSGG